MAALHVPLLVVSGPDGKALGTITAQSVLGASLEQG